jgi:hypothetical protein
VIIGPPKRQPKDHRPIALLTPGYRRLTIETEAGIDVAGTDRVYDALDALEKHAVYIDGGLSRLRFCTPADWWEASTWKGNITSMQLDGQRTTVHSLRGCLEGSRDPFGDLFCALSFLNARGIRSAGIPSMGWNLWRSTLTREYNVNSPERAGRGAFYGGRKWAKLRPDHKVSHYTHMVGVDLSGAYPFAMTCRPYALQLRAVHKDTRIDPERGGIVRGTCRIPNGPSWCGPLPERIAEDIIRFPTGGGPIRGYWTWEEAYTAMVMGCDLRVEECWAPESEADLFSPAWLSLIETGRALPGKAGKVIKAAVNSTWGRFAMSNGGEGITRWENHRGERRVNFEIPGRRMPYTATCHIAAETASRVRTRVLRDALSNRDFTPIHVDTDGFICRKSQATHLPREAPIGQWRVKDDMREVEIKAAQCYRYRCPGCGVTHDPWHYKVSGVNQSQAKQVFREGGQHVGRAFDFVIDSAHTGDRETIKRSYWEALAELEASYH